MKKERLFISILVLAAAISLSSCSSTVRSAESSHEKETTRITEAAATSTPAPTATPTPTPTPSPTKAPTPTPEPTPTPTPTPTLSPEEKEASYISAEYKEYARNPDTHLGELIKMDGKIVQVLEEDSDGGKWLTLRVAQDSDYDSIWMVGYLLPDGESRILVDDKVALYGIYGGVTSYETVMGDTVTVPLLYADGAVIK